MRTVYFNPASRNLVSDDTDPKAGGMAHHYFINDIWQDGSSADQPPIRLGEVKFQHGPVKEVGKNGLQHADLYRVLIDRLECAQAGPFACEENAEQLDLVRRALFSDEARTARRVSAGTEGRNVGR